MHCIRGQMMELNREKVRRRLEEDGWVLVRHGSRHDIYRHLDRPGIITLPRHRKLTPLVARSIAKAAGWLERE